MANSPMVVFHNDSDSSYANYAGNLSSMSIAAEAVTLRFLGQGSSTSGTDAVVLGCAAGNEETVLEAVAGAMANARDGMTIIADDKNSKYLIPEITGVTSISINTGAANIQTVITTTVDRTLTVAESGSKVVVNHAARVITLPPAQAGLYFEVLLLQDTTAGAGVIVTAGDTFFGQIKVTSPTEDQMETQDITHATAIAAPTTYDCVELIHDDDSYGGKAGDVLKFTAVDAAAWHVEAFLVTDHANPAAIAVINDAI